MENTIKKIFGKPVWGTDWTLVRIKKEYTKFQEALKIARKLWGKTGIAHKVEQYPGKNIFQIWKEIPPLEWRKTSLAKELGF